MPFPVTFTGTSGTELVTSDSNWTESAATSGTLLISDANRVRKGTVSQAGYYTYNETLPSSPDYTVLVDFVIKSTSHIDRIGIVARGSVDTLNFYLLRLTGGSTSMTVALMKANGASPTIITSTTKTVVDETSYRLGLRCTGTLIEVIDRDNSDNVLLSTTDSDHTSAGRVGIYYSSDGTTLGNSNGIHLDNLDLEEAATRTCDLTSTLAAVTISAAATENIVVDLSNTLNNVTISSDVTETVIVDLSSTLESVSISATASADSGSRTCDLSVTLESTSLTSALASDLVVSSSITLTDTTLSGQGVVETIVNSSNTLASVILTSTVESGDSRELDLNVTLENTSISSGIASSIVASVSKTLDGVLISSDIDVQIVVNASKQLADVSLTANAGQMAERIATLSLTLANVTISASITPKVQPTRVAKRTVKISSIVRR